MFRNNYADSETTYNCIDEDNEDFGFVTMDEPSNFLGIGKRDKQKKAAKKVEKAAKQLAKGHIKAAERKLQKGEKLLSIIQRDQTGLINARNKIQDINQTTAVINATNPMQTESGNTAPGQIGTEAGATVTPSALAAQQSSSGGGGGTGAGDVGDSTGQLQDSGETVSDSPGANDVKELPGVTVKSSHNNIIFIIIAAAIVFAVIYFLPKLLKK